MLKAPTPLQVCTHWLSQSYAHLGAACIDDWSMWGYKDRASGLRQDPSEGPCQLQNPLRSLWQLHALHRWASLPAHPTFLYPSKVFFPAVLPRERPAHRSSLVLSHQEADLWQNPSFEFSDFLLFSFLGIGCLGLISCDFHICFHILGFSLFLLLGNLINTGFLILLLIFFAVFHLSLRGPILIFLF